MKDKSDPLMKKYYTEIVPILMKEFTIKNRYALPKLKSISINIGLGEALTNKNVLTHAAKQLAQITGQKPKTTVARRSIASFKLRAGMAVGLKVTLRGERMYAFFRKLTSIVMPRMRDFRGVSRRHFDGKGNYSLGLSEQTLFPEIIYDQIDKARGLQITLVTSAKNDKLGTRLLELMGMPFIKEELNL